MTPQPKEILEHYKTKGQYEILALGCLQVKEPSLDMCDYVIYQALSDKKIWGTACCRFYRTSFNRRRGFTSF
jgi:hypothetical protein